MARPLKTNPSCSVDVFSKPIGKLNKAGRFFVFRVPLITCSLRTLFKNLLVMRLIKRKVRQVTQRHPKLSWPNT